MEMSEMEWKLLFEMWSKPLLCFDGVKDGYLISSYCATIAVI